MSMAKHWNKTEAWLHDAKGIAFDGCHKIYVLMDDQQMAEMKECGYDPLLSAQDLTVDAMLSTVKDWYEKSCGLRFINAVSTDSEDPNAGFVDLIPQGAEE